MDRLDTLPEHAHILAIIRHIHRVPHPQLVSQYYRLSFMHQFILCKVVHNLGASRAVVLEVDLQGDLVAEDLHSYPLLSRLAMGRLECLH